MSDVVISVVVPVFNVERYLEKTLNCILEQSYKKFELLLVDDGSTDSSGRMCDEFAKKDARVRVFHNQNQGPAKTRNFGIEKAEGTYIAFVDSDDLITKYYLENLIAGYEYPKVDLTMCGYERFDSETGQTTSTHIVGDWSRSIFMSNRELARLFTVPRTSLSGVSIWAKLYKREIIMKHNVRFPLGIDYEEDCCFNVQYFRHVNRTVAINKSMYRYRQSTQSLSKVYKETTYKFLVNGYNERKKFVNELENPKQLCAGLDTVFLVVTIDNFKKIVKSPMAKEKKLEMYKSMLEYKELGEVMDNCSLSKVKLTRKITLACRERNAKKIEKVMNAWVRETKMKERIHSVLSKIKRNIKK